MWPTLVVFPVRVRECLLIRCFIAIAANLPRGAGEGWGSDSSISAKLPGDQRASFLSF